MNLEHYSTPHPQMNRRIKRTQGQGDGTRFKERRLEAIFYINLTICNKSERLRRFPYFHFDLYAGSGYNDQADCLGSPLAFLDAVEESGKHHFYAHFVDKDPINCHKLFNRLKTSVYADRCFVHPGDNADFVEAIPYIIKARNISPDHAMGSVLIDPNGHNIPWDHLIELSKLCPKLDFFINYNTTVALRIEGLKKYTYRGRLERLADVPKLLGKNYVQIATPVGARNRFVLLICRNFFTSNYARLGIYHWDSYEGESIRYRFGLSKKERGSNQGCLL